MRDAITNLLQMNPRNLIPEVMWVCIFLWCIVLLCSLQSIASQDLRLGAKYLWAAVIVLLPLAGLLAYCFFAVTRLRLGLVKGGPKLSSGLPVGGYGRRRSGKLAKPARGTLLPGTSKNGGSIE